MKLNALLCSAVLATSMVTVAHADNTTHVAAASALGSIAGTAIGKSMGGTNGGYIGAALGAAGGSALGNKISKDRDADRSSKYWKKNTVIIVTNYRDEIGLKTPSGVFL